MSAERTAAKSPVAGEPGGAATSPGSTTAAVNHDAQADWFVREVKRCREIGMPLGCCEDWPECAHVLAWMEERDA